MATIAVAPGTMKVTRAYKPGARFQIVEREIPTPREEKVQSSLVSNEEESLLACARAGDGMAFASLVMPHRECILRLTPRILRNREDAEDVVQTAFLEALRHLDDFQGRSRFSSWLTRIALNAAFMRLRSTRRKTETSLDEMFQCDTARELQVVDARPNPEQECTVTEARLVLAKAINRLGPLYSDV